MHITAHSSSHWLTTFDPRVKIIVCGVLGVLAWQVPPAGLALYGIAVLFLVYQAGLLGKAQRPVLGSYLRFVLFWGVLVFALELTPMDFSPPVLTAAAQKAGLLAARLTLLICLGLVLALTASPRQLGLGLAWFLRPILGKNSWKTALSLALMIHFLPLVQQTFRQVRHAMLLRQPPRSTMQRFLLIPQAVLRILGQKTWTQTVAVAARGLDRPEAWQQNMPANISHWLLGAGTCAAALAIRMYWHMLNSLL